MLAACLQRPVRRRLHNPLPTRTQSKIETALYCEQATANMECSRLLVMLHVHSCSLIGRQPISCAWTCFRGLQIFTEADFGSGAVYRSCAGLAFIACLSFVVCNAVAATLKRGGRSKPGNCAQNCTGGTLRGLLGQIERSHLEVALCENSSNPIR